MQQLTCVGPGKVEWIDVPEPALQGPDEALVRPLTTSRCAIDPILMAVGPSGRGEGAGFALGHEGVAEVLAVGSGVTGFSVGQIVVPAFQVSCGRCARCSVGHTAVCESYPVLSDYGMQPLSGVEYGGMLSDVVRVPHADAMLHLVPPGLTPVELAGVADNVADGHRGVAPHLAEQPGADVLVACHGNHGIGLFAAQSALALGAGRVTFASDDEDALAIAARVGAVPLRTDFGRRDGRFPIVVDCGLRAEGLQYAVASTEPEGVCHSVSGYVDSSGPEFALPFFKMYTLGIRFLIGRLHATAVIPKVLDLIAAGRLRPADVTTSLVAWDDAADRYADPTIKLVVARDEAHNQVEAPTP
jgi:alcohol dehydrogenase